MYNIYIMYIRPYRSLVYSHTHAITHTNTPAYRQTCFDIHKQTYVDSVSRKLNLKVSESSPPDSDTRICSVSFLLQIINVTFVALAIIENLKNCNVVSLIFS